MPRTCLPMCLHLARPARPCRGAPSRCPTPHPLCGRPPLGRHPEVRPTAELRHQRGGQGSGEPFWRCSGAALLSCRPSGLHLPSLATAAGTDQGLSFLSGHVYVAGGVGGTFGITSYIAIGFRCNGIQWHGAGASGLPGTGRLGSLAVALLPLLCLDFNPPRPGAVVFAVLSAVRMATVVQCAALMATSWSGTPTRCRCSSK